MAGRLSEARNGANRRLRTPANRGMYALLSASTITICLNETTGIIRPELHGQFAEHLGACIDGGLWVGEESRIPNLGGLRTDVLEALRKLRPPVLRWPGGCFA